MSLARADVGIMLDTTVRTKAGMDSLVAAAVFKNIIISGLGP